MSPPHSLAWLGSFPMITYRFLVVQLRELKKLPQPSISPKLGFSQISPKGFVATLMMGIRWSLRALSKTSCQRLVSLWVWVITRVTYPQSPDEELTRADASSKSTGSMMWIPKRLLGTEAGS